MENITATFTPTHASVTILPLGPAPDRGPGIVPGGTARRNRAGDLCDFRPAEVISHLEYARDGATLAFGRGVDCPDVEGRILFPEAGEDAVTFTSVNVEGIAIPLKFPIRQPAIVEEAANLADRMAANEAANVARERRNVARLAASTAIIEWAGTDDAREAIAGIVTIKGSACRRWAAGRNNDAGEDAALAAFRYAVEKTGTEAICGDFPRPHRDFPFFFPAAWRAVFSAVKAEIKNRWPREWRRED